NLAAALEHRGRIDEAIKSLDRALMLTPDRADVWYRMGLLLEQQNRKDEASLSFDAALKADPRHLKAANAAALAHLNARRYEPALSAFAASLAIDPAQDGALHLMGICQLRLRRFDEAYESCSRALTLAPGDPEINCNLGLILSRRGLFTEAIGRFDAALALDPHLALVHCLRAGTFAELRRFDEALADYDKALALDPELADAHWNGALLRLLLGDFETGWKERQWGRKCADLKFVDRQFAQPLWHGETDIAGKTILLHSDEGLGDSIQFARYATLVARLGARVILEVQDAVHPLLSGIEGVALCLPKTGVTLPDFDLQCPTSDLPLAFATRLESIPSPRAYLPLPPEACVREWQGRLGAHDKLRV